MSNFKPLTDLSVAKKESEIADYWNDHKTLDKSIETREGKRPFVFYEGPPTANGKPGIHHVIWYIRRSRRRFWGSELTDDKKAVNNTTYEILVGLSKLVAPFAPYISEELYRSLTELSVHLADYPVADSQLIDGELETRMDLMRNLVGLGRAAREQVRIKVRQPVQQILIDGKYEQLIDYMLPLIKEELNVKAVVFA